jgi:hypothetical protein
VYFCSLLAALNSREALLEKLGDFVISDPENQVKEIKTQLSDPRFAVRMLKSSQNRRKNSLLLFQPIVISVSREVQVDVAGANGKRNSKDSSPLSSTLSSEQSEYAIQEASH